MSIAGSDYDVYDMILQNLQISSAGDLSDMEDNDSPEIENFRRTSWNWAQNHEPEKDAISRAKAISEQGAFYARTEAGKKRYADLKKKKLLRSLLIYKI